MSVIFIIYSEYHILLLCAKPSSCVFGLFDFISLISFNIHSLKLINEVNVNCLFRAVQKVLLSQWQRLSIASNEV